MKSFIEQGLKTGARAVLQGEVQETGECFDSPTIFDGVEPTMAIVREEIFGPVLCVQKFRTEAEALPTAPITP